MDDNLRTGLKAVFENAIATQANPDNLIDSLLDAMEHIARQISKEELKKYAKQFDEQAKSKVELIETRRKERLEVYKGIQSRLGILSVEYGEYVAENQGNLIPPQGQHARIIEATRKEVLGMSTNSLTKNILERLTSSSGSVEFKKNRSAINDALGNVQELIRQLTD